MSLVIRPARPDEAGLVFDFIHQLAVYEKLAHEVETTPEEIGKALFGPAPRAFCDIAEWDGVPVGFAFWFYTFSTFHGKHGIYLEDLFVNPDQRGKGIGKALIANLAQRCVREGLPRLQWWVLNWNTPAIDFYRSIGALPMDEWTTQRVTGEALKRLAGAHDIA
jgi:GNAT superfamily N-acetyltransferase